MKKENINNNINVEALNNWAEMYNKKDKEHFKDQLKLARAEQKLEKIKEIIKQDKFYGEEYSPKYVLVSKILQIIKGE